MSKRAGAVPQETRGRILSAAAAEFAERGFQGSSLRGICSAAGVTTGALYFFFEGKDDLFETVLSEATEPFNRLVAEHYRQERLSSRRDSQEGGDADLEVTKLVIDLYFRHRQAWDILMGHLNHPAVQAFLDGFIDESTQHYRALLEETTPNRQMDLFAIHQFVHMQVDTMLTLFSHGFSREEMIMHSKTVVCMLRGAFCALLNDEAIRG